MSRIFGVTDDYFSFLFDELFFNKPKKKLSIFDKKENGYELNLGVPGCKQEDVSVEIEGEKILIQVKKGEDKSSFSITLPIDHGEIEKIKATVVDGLLTISIPFKTISRIKILP